MEGNVRSTSNPAGGTPNYNGRTQHASIAKAIPPTGIVSGDDCCYGQEQRHEKISSFTTTSYNT